MKQLVEETTTGKQSQRGPSGTDLENKESFQIAVEEVYNSYIEQQAQELSLSKGEFVERLLRVTVLQLLLNPRRYRRQYRQLLRGFDDAQPKLMEVNDCPSPPKKRTGWSLTPTCRNLIRFLAELLNLTQGKVLQKLIDIHLIESKQHNSKKFEQLIQQIRNLPDNQELVIAKFTPEQLKAAANACQESTATIEEDDLDANSWDYDEQSHSPTDLMSRIYLTAMEAIGQGRSAELARQNPTLTLIRSAIQTTQDLSRFRFQRCC
ncbi:hypothetical protein [Alkalinema sp. FACHB-956]|uniref:hypothetical protein n=1 Tax=Alkalinema sp. FACHB-956 TaxID=2692768 RepID=UPI001682EE53|nr:hypothetical protein [Alkalinema sp. FACHB-956]MBD2329671.1 hypothetical protein [Alkalinema sp. FACHB-956]